MTFQDDLNRLLAGGYDRLTADLPTSDAPPLATMTVHKHAAYLPLSVEQQLAAGLITEAEARVQGWEPYVPPPTPWRWRLRWRWLAWRERTGRKVGGWIAGVDLSERDEDW